MEPEPDERGDGMRWFGATKVRRVAAGVLLGALAVGAFSLTRRPAEAKPLVLREDNSRVALDEGRVEAALRDARARLGRDLTPEERAAVRAALVDDEVLAREAIRRGVGFDDPLVRERLSLAMRRTLLAELPPSAESSEEDIAREMNATPPREGEGRVRLEVHFFGQTRSAPAAAMRSAERFAGGGSAEGASDRAPIPDGAWWTEDELSRAAGIAVARAAMTTAIGSRSSPVTSAWGIWVVVPLERRASDPAERHAIAARALRERNDQEALQSRIASIRAGYRVATENHP